MEPPKPARPLWGMHLTEVGSIVALVPGSYMGKVVFESTGGIRGYRSAEG